MYFTTQKNSGAFGRPCCCSTDHLSKLN